ncbi:TetR/AcrR family transcriptional regulator [Actinomycetospora endophytica]|uniref:TetR/AcrR family transcriptional regulator n=1 Tax=Actinomycetospora endophytica TaxID=2291215 RepID=A0ABS8P8X2_9PSEU|nr:TetR/AcrR family transcriptional regulator [Actinomycetospora endophytica]MCD2194716.1 TetR/AcrR family transcriptional regulator [Actinomycetospora endophytica]
MSARDRRRSRTRQEFARAAARLFETQGFAATTVEEIAGAADYSASTFFRLFERKEDALFVDLDDSEDVLSTRMATVIAGGEWSAIREGLLRHATAWEADDPDFAATRTRLIHREPALARVYREHLEQWQAGIAAHLEQVRGAESEDDVMSMVAAGAIVSIYRAALRRQARLGGTIADHLERALDVFETSGSVSPLLDVARPATP